MDKDESMKFPERNERNPGLREGSVKLCSRGELLSVHRKVSQCPTSVMNVKTYEYINMNNIQLI